MDKCATGTKQSRFSQYLVISLLLPLALLLVTAPTVAFGSSHAATRVGPKRYYLALGNSLAFGYQPNFNFNNGYADDLSTNLQSHGVRAMANLACPAETTSTFINGGCPGAFLRKYTYLGSQLSAALLYLAQFKGQVSPVTLDIGADDVLPDITMSTCTINVSQFKTDLATLDTNLRNTILPRLHKALLINGQVSADIALMNYYDPYQNICPNSVPYLQMLDQHLAQDAAGYAVLVDAFAAFGGATTPNANICSYTWECSVFQDIHPTDTGYSVLATTFENTLGY